MIKTIKPRLPRLGVIRLGEKEVSQKSGKEYPVNRDHFILPREGEDGFDLVQGRLPEDPETLRIHFPLSSVEDVLSDYYRMYGQSGLLCKGDGEKGLYPHYEERKDTKGKPYTHKELKERDCASLGCPFAAEKTCKPTAILSFCLSDIPGLGIWQITTHSIIALQSFRATLELALQAFGRLAGIPFELFRYPVEVSPDGKKKTVTGVGLRMLAGANVLPAATSPALPPAEEKRPEKKKLEPREWVLKSSSYEEAQDRAVTCIQNGIDVSIAQGWVDEWAAAHPDLAPIIESSDPMEAAVKSAKPVKAKAPPETLVEIPAQSFVAANGGEA